MKRIVFWFRNGIRNKKPDYTNDPEFFDKWRTGATGCTLQELATIHAKTDI